MRLGMLVRADRGGLAAQTMEVWRHLEPDRTLVIDLGPRGRGPLDAGPFSTEVCTPDGMDVDRFLTGLDVVWSAETFYAEGFIARARAVGVRTVLHANPELFKDGACPPSATWVPTTWEQRRLPGSVHVPMPVARDRFLPKERSEVRTFLHVAAPAFHDRNGSRLVAAALSYVSSACRLLIRGAKDLEPMQIGNVEVAPVPESNNYWEWPTADALVLPRRYGGLSLVMQEAASLGMPILTLDLDPQRDWLAPESLVRPMPWRDVDMVGGRFHVWSVHPQLLAERMDALVSSADLSWQLSKASDAWAAGLDWKRWTKWWRDALAETMERAP